MSISLIAVEKDKSLNRKNYKENHETGDFSKHTHTPLMLEFLRLVFIKFKYQDPFPYKMKKTFNRAKKIDSCHEKKPLFLSHERKKKVYIGGVFFVFIVLLNLYILKTAEEHPGRWVRMLKNRDPQIQKEAEERLLKMGDKAVLTVIDALRDPDPRHRSAMIVFLGKAGNFQAVDCLIKHLEDPSADVRMESVKALIKIGDDKAIAPLTDFFDFNSDYTLAEMFYFCGEPRLKQKADKWREEQGVNLFPLKDPEERIVWRQSLSPRPGF